MAPSKGSKCIVPNCKAGYASCKQKFSLFSVPDDEKMVEQWQKAIPRKDFVVQSGQVVCQQHFLEDDIVWKKEVKAPDGSVMSSAKLKRPYLKHGSIPRIFPDCPKYLTNTTKQRKPPKKGNHFSIPRVQKE
ncbi:uncharacterized protein LOC122513081 [Leptopilina heterotoma]|uniref:uncharacterized protein LOC122513081 n=1 Tax=Leptopilina heterotoma TaxID=63436 RepID=UPI001CA8159C|nr:uncharacterized protein LOC122513081 [Leptopilina heterotoma]